MVDFVRARLKEERGYGDAQEKLSRYARTGGQILHFQTIDLFQELRI